MDEDIMIFLTFCKPLQIYEVAFQSVSLHDKEFIEKVKRFIKAQPLIKKVLFSSADENGLKELELYE